MLLRGVGDIGAQGQGGGTSAPARSHCIFPLAPEGSLGWWLKQGPWSPISWTQIPALQFTGCVSSGRLVKLSGPQSAWSVTWGNGNDLQRVFQGPHVQAHSVSLNIPGFVPQIFLWAGSSHLVSIPCDFVIRAIEYFGPTFQYYGSGLAAYKTFAQNSVSASYYYH